MSVITTEAFVLRSYKLAEQDKIVVLFTKDRGKIRLVAKGARKNNNRFGAALEILTHVRIVFHEKLNRELQLLDRDPELLCTIRPFFPVAPGIPQPSTSADPPWKAQLIL